MTGSSGYYTVEVLETPTSRWMVGNDTFSTFEKAIAEARNRITYGAQSTRVMQVTEQELWRGLSDKPTPHITEIVPNALPNIAQQLCADKEPK